MFFKLEVVFLVQESGLALAEQRVQHAFKFLSHSFIHYFKVLIIIISIDKMLLCTLTP